MRLVLAALVASTGCAQLFGLDETSGAGPNTDFATLQIQKVSIGASVIKTPLDVSNEMATFYDDSAGTLAPVPGVLSGMETFQGDAPGTPSVLFTVPDVQVPTRMFALPARAQRGNYVELEHPGPQEPFPNSSIMLNVTLPSAFVSGESFLIHAIGAWMSKGLGVGVELPAPDLGNSTIAASIPYTDFNPSVGGNPRTRIAAADVVLLLRTTALPAPTIGTSTGNSRLSGVFQAQFDQTDGADPMTGMMTNVLASTTVMAAVDPPGFTTRFAAVRPAVNGTSLTWTVNAAPGWSLGVDTGVRLITGAVMPEDTTIAAMYGNPFESLDWKAVMRFSVTSPRNYSYFDPAANGLSVNVVLNANFTTLTEPSTTLDLASAAGLPILIEANQTPLVTDGNELIIDPTMPVVIEANLDRPTNTAYQLTLVELGVNIVDVPVLTRTIRLDVVTAGEPTFKLPPELFTVGRSYYVTIRSHQGGLTGAADGDLQTVSLPYSLASLDSAVFTVGMP